MGPPIEYAGHLETRKIEHNGMMRWKNGRIFTSKTLFSEYVGLEEIGDGICPLLRAGAAGRLRRTGDEVPWLIGVTPERTEDDS